MLTEPEDGRQLLSTKNLYQSYKSELQTRFTIFRDLFGVAEPRNLRLVGVLTAVPYSMSSSVCLLFFRCC